MAEEVGKDYFNVLISRSFFQVSSSFGGYFIMHDLVNDIASFVSGEFCFRREGSDSPNSLSKTRHFSHNHEADRSSVEVFEALQQAKCLRTFLSLKPCRWWMLETRCDILPKSQCLRVLKLYGYNIKVLPDSINNFKHLMYLDSSMTPIKKLPDTVCTLYNLQALVLSGCKDLTELPANLGRLVNLSNLDITHTPIKKMPPRMGNLKDLQMLPKFVLDKHTAGDNLAELKKLEKLRGRLRISRLVHGSRLEAYILRDKRFLKELVLEWGPRVRRARYSRGMDWTGRHSSEEDNNSVEERGVLEKLQPHMNLERLTIKGYGGKMFAGWSEYYSSSALIYLKLVNCENCISLPPWGRLPSLTELDVRDCPNLTGRLASDSLPSLVSLTVWNCPEFECFPEDGFASKLKSLDISECKKLTAKSAQNLNKCLRRLTSLEELKLDFHCNKNVDWSAEEQQGLFPSTLTYLQIGLLNCETIHGAKWFGHLNSLQKLIIYDCSALRCLPDSGLPASLQCLEISNCPALQCLPDSGLPTSLQKLEILGCPALQCLPDSGLPSSLSDLRIIQCPLLEKRCQRETGEDWPKIAHIRYR